MPVSVSTFWTGDDPLQHTGDAAQFPRHPARLLEDEREQRQQPVTEHDRGSLQHDQQQVPPSIPATVHDATTIKPPLPFNARIRFYVGNGYSYELIIFIL
ncbi:hypothetical protein QE152_g26456 [Popillia japonica]|uniref:Uncharacterized protein n=1 Tax=Popillia japonica TaxID=7064 RepID=A0AAW1JWY2_POPJA